MRLFAFLPRHRPVTPHCTMRTRVWSVFGVTVLLGTLLGCAPVTVELWSDEESVAPVVEQFNAAQDRFVVELHYHSDVRAALRREERSADVVIAAGIENLTTARTFRPLDQLMNDGIDRQQFYASALANGERDGRQLLIPVSFNLPLIYFAEGGSHPIDGITISPEQMREAGLAFNEIEDERANQLAFSPLWDGAFLYELLRLEGFVVSESESGDPRWSLDALLSGLDVASFWVAENGGVAVDRRFQEKFLYNPIIRLARQGRVEFGYDTSDRFFSRSDATRHDLEFRWLGREGAVPVLEPIVYVASPSHAPNRPGANAFMTWLFGPDVQRELLANNRRKRIDSFGIVGGFSTLWRVTEQAMPEQYPVLTSSIPPASWLRFPPPSPNHWETVVNRIVQPWLLREVAGQPQSRDLAESVSAWMLQQED